MHRHSPARHKIPTRTSKRVEELFTYQSIIINNSGVLNRIRDARHVMKDSQLVAKGERENVLNENCKLQQRSVNSRETNCQTIADGIN